jgi:hypothetical protein
MLDTHLSTSTTEPCQSYMLHQYLTSRSTTVTERMAMAGNGRVEEVPLVLQKDSEGGKGKVVNSTQRAEA